MTEEFEDRDLADAVFWGVSLRRATFRDVDFTGARTHHVFIDDVEIDGFVDGLVVNGVDVTDYVRERDPWGSLRAVLRPATADEVRSGWNAVRERWDAVIAAADAIDATFLSQRVDDEWSFDETLRHLLFVTDKWVLGPLQDGADTHRFHPAGLPNSGSADADWPGIVRGTEPTREQIRSARAEHAARIDTLAEALHDDDLRQQVEILEAGTGPALACWHTLLEEEFEHLRYALRDLARLHPPAAHW